MNIVSNASNRIELDDVRFFATAAFVLLGPSLMFCLILDQAWPMYLIISSQLIGATVGAVRFRNSINSLLSCIPTPRSSKKSRNVGSQGWKKAA